MLRCQCPSVRLSVTEVHWSIIANLGFKLRSKFTAHCGRGECGREGRDHRRVEGSSRAKLATVRPSCQRLQECSVKSVIGLHDIVGCA